MYMYNEQAIKPAVPLELVKAPKSLVAAPVRVQADCGHASIMCTHCIAISALPVVEVELNAPKSFPAAADKKEQPSHNELCVCVP